MNKHDVITGIKSLAATGEIQLNELIAAFEQGSGVTNSERSDSASTLSRYSGILYYIGGGIVFLGLVFFMAEIWDSLNAFMRIFITLGVGLAAYVVGVLFNQQHRLGSAGPVFFMISALLIPAGILISLDEYNIRLDDDKIQNYIAAVLFVTYLLSYILFKRYVLLIFACLFGTWFYFVLTSTLLNNAILLPDWEFIYYQFAALGLSYLFIGYAYKDTDKQGLVKILYLVGINSFLCAMLALTGWRSSQNMAWEIIYPGIVFAGLYVSAQIRSRIILASCALYLSAYIIKITVEYFSDGLGWPVTLILCGFILMGMGYATIQLKRKYNI